MNNKSILIFAPFFNNPKHVGGYRIRRIIKWLTAQNYSINVVSLGKISLAQKEIWGTNIIIHSSTLNLLENLLSIGLKFYPVKIIYVALKFILKIVYLPDEERLWAKKVSKNKKIKTLAKEASFYFSSSPLESAHIAPFLLSKTTKIPTIVDLRDGWMDESLKYKLFKSLKFQEKHEKRLEKRVLDNASLIFVTTYNWKKRLVERYPEFDKKIIVLTNAYPDIYIDFVKLVNNYSNKEIALYYTGRFAGSSRDRKISLLFKPFNEIELKSFAKIDIKIYSDLRRVDLQEIEKLAKSNSEKEYTFEISEFIPRLEIIDKLKHASGVLLLSVSQNAIPAKFFEYVILKKPVLVITYKNNSVWEVCSELPQFFLYDLEGEASYNAKVTESFLNACNTGNYEYMVPEKYSENYLEKVFLSNVDSFL